MIRNERQYRITKAQAQRLARAASQLKESSRHPGDVHPLLLRAEEEALRSQLEDLTAELREYEELWAARAPLVELESFDDLPRALIRARIASRMSQRELAERLGLKEQQIQRYEATEYASASMRRIREIVRALDIRVRQGEALEGDASAAVMFRRLKAAGLDQEFVLKRLVPRALSAGLEGEKGKDGALVCHVTGLVGRIFGWTSNQVLGPEPLRLDDAALAGVRFKVPARVNERRLTAYTVYAHYLALLVLAATQRQRQQRIRVDAKQVRETIVSRYGSVTFEHALDYVWSLGIPVLPLSDAGAFHAACWRAKGRSVIVLKQRTRLPWFWLFDLMHELWHAGEAPDEEELAVVEEGDHWSEVSKSPEEEAAGQFAGDVILAGRSEELAQLCVEVARGSVERLKGAVTRVAAQEGVSAEGLANYMAFRLARQGTRWWGTAMSLQRTSGNPWQEARDRLLRELETERLSEVDGSILMQALSDEG